MKREVNTSFLVLGYRVVLGGWKWAPARGLMLERGEAIARENEYPLIEQFLIFLPGSPSLKFLTRYTLYCLLEIGGSRDCRVVQFRPKIGRP